MTTVERYESIWNELTDFLSSRCGAVDEKALRIVLAAAWNHQFTSDAPISLWAQGVPPGFAQSFGAALGRPIWRPSPGLLAQRIKAQTTKDQSLWVVRDADKIFSGSKNQTERFVELYAGIASGHYEWVPSTTKIDKLLGWVMPFVWEGRVSVVLTSEVALGVHQAKQCKITWPAAQNTFSVVRFSSLEGSLSQLIAAQTAMRNSQATGILGRLLLNLMDVDHREKGFRSVRQVGRYNALAVLDRRPRKAVGGPAEDPDKIHGNSVGRGCQAKSRSSICI